MLSSYRCTLFTKCSVVLNNRLDLISVSGKKGLKHIRGVSGFLDSIDLHRLSHSVNRTIFTADLDPDQLDELLGEHRVEAVTCNGRFNVLVGIFEQRAIDQRLQVMD